MSEPIRFYCRGAVHTVDGVSPTQTVLQHLPEDWHGTGTKEGCAEGDCGACTVVLGSLEDGQQALVECHASQCGFCTPGFVMPLWGLYLNHDAQPQSTPCSRQQIDDALSGMCASSDYRMAARGVNVWEVA